MHCAAQSIKVGDLVFDIGAHKGDKTVWFVDRGARVVAVEPQSLMAAALRDRFSSNANVVVVEKGLSNEPGKMVLKINSAAPTISTFCDHWTTGRFADQTWDSKEAVVVTTLDALIREFGEPKYAKIDVEGFEVQVLKGLTRRLELLSFEFTKEFINEAHKALRHASSIGFTAANLSLGEDDRYLEDDWTPINEFSRLLNAVVAGGPPDIWGDIYLT